jgi:VanZ family protein
MRKLTYFLPAVLFYSAIFVVSSRSLGFITLSQWLDKIPHAIEFALLGLLLSHGFFNSLATSPRLKIALTVLCGMVLGVLDEFHQKFVKGRTSDPRDAAADAIGVAIGVAIYSWYFLKKKKRAADK